MPGKRPAKKGSFGGHFDELVKHFPGERPKPRPEEGKAGGGQDGGGAH